MTDQPREQSHSGCGAALAWFLAVGLIRAIGRELGWCDRAQVIAVVVALVLVVIFMAARQKAEKPEHDRSDHEGQAQVTDEAARHELLRRLAADMRQLMLIRALRD
jgi:predicted MFS family arabinose efflux permease